MQESNKIVSVRNNITEFFVKQKKSKIPVQKYKLIKLTKGYGIRLFSIRNNYCKILVFDDVNLRNVHLLNTQECPLFKASTIVVNTLK